MTEDFVILVDENDEQIGICEKLKAHQKGGILHRAFSVFLTNSKGEVLLQQRAQEKYHSPMLWTNTCCSHPRPGESAHDGAKRRLKEEMGIETNLQFLFSFIYKVDFDNGLTEFEFDHVFHGITDDLPVINQKEVNTFQYLKPEQIQESIIKNPEQFTEWFKICWKEFVEKSSVYTA